MASGPVISLTDSVGLRLIIIDAYGVEYSNQTGGTSCLRPTAVGFFVPSRNDCSMPERTFLSPENELLDYFIGPLHRGTGARCGLTSQDADFIDQVLTRCRLATAITVDRRRLRDSHEAWVHVIVQSDEGDRFPVFMGFGPYPRSGVLTWSNSD